MNKNAIKKYVVWARKELISRVSFKAAQMGITESGISEEDSDSVNGVLLTNEQKAKRTILIKRVKEKGFSQIVEEAAYTWFNRFIALRYMEVNSILPSMVRVFTDDNNNFKPQILDEALNLDFEGLDKDKIFDLKDKSDDEGLYKYLLIAQCNALNKELPAMFSKIEDYTELLFPDNLLRTGSVVEQMVTAIPEEDWKDQVQIIGWMYQYWNIEPKETAMKGKSYKKEDFAAVTQLFTPDWIVRYMVENSLGRVWKETHPEFDTSIWKYYLEESPENAGKVAATLENTDLENLTFLDPCMGSGHILVYAFDVFMSLYASRGVGKRDAVRNIITKNIFGIDLDKRAWQLSYFALKMKACQYDANFLSRGIEPNVYYMQDLGLPENSGLTGELKAFAEQFRYADIYGSLTPAKKVSDVVIKQVEDFKEDLLNTGAKAVLERMVETAKVLDNKYSIVVTNPPYMATDMNPILSDYVRTYFPDSKTDLFAVFIEKCSQFSKYLYAMITMHSWMCLSSYEDLRRKLQKNTTINMAHLGAHAFDEIAGEFVQTTSFINCIHGLTDYKGTYVKLLDYYGEDNKRNKFLEKQEIYHSNSNDFLKIPGNPIAYWASSNAIEDYEKGVSVSKWTEPFQGIITGSNDKFLRYWYEVELQKLPLGIDDINKVNLNKQYWIPYNKGGDFRKWYGIQDYVVYWKNGPDDKVRGKKQFSKYYLKEYTSWSYTVSTTIGMRFYPAGFLWDVRGSGLMGLKDKLYYVMGAISSNVGMYFFRLNNTTLSCQVENIIQLPIIINEKYRNTVEEIVKENISLSKADWDSFETSWDFARHPLMPHYSVNNPDFKEEYQGHALKVSEMFDLWNKECSNRFAKLKANEEELNRIFIEIYGLKDELTPEVLDKDVTVRKADLTREIKSLLSYAVGCMLGRYSISVEGLIFAGGDTIVDTSYEPFGVDKDNIIPVCDKAYFDDDITGRFSRFIELVYGKETLDENLQFIADALGGGGKEPLGVIRSYFLNDFYKDHCKIYQNKPIYWMFDAGKKNSFKALIYMHRYQNTTIANLRTEYVHKQQTRLKSIIDDLETRTNSATGSAKIKLSKELSLAKEQSAELHVFEEKIHHLADQMLSIDLDDGVKHNYEIFGDVLAKIK